MKRALTLLPLLLVCLDMSYAQDQPRVIIDIPTDQKPWSHSQWNVAEGQFQFAIVTDRTGGERPGIFPIGIKKLNLLQPEFVMSVGDLIEGYTEDTAQLNAEWREFMGFIDDLKAPFFYVPGNHDITNKVMDEKWKELFGVTYYHFIYNDVLFLCLNSEDNIRGAGRGTIDDEQYAYIQKTLEENQNVRWTMVFMHQPLWVQEDTKRWKDVENLLKDRNHHVFAGHYHRYWKTERNQGNYIALATTGGGSAMRGRAYGEFDHVVWITMTEEGPVIANLFLDGVWNEDVVTEEMVDLVRNRPFPVKIETRYLADLSLTEATTTLKITNSSDHQMQVKLSGNIHPDLFYQLSETDLLVNPNDVKEVTLELQTIGQKPLLETAPIMINAEINYDQGERPSVSFSDQLRFLPNRKYPIDPNEKIKLDGNLKEWGDNWIDIEKYEGKPFDFDGEDDLSMRFATAYDDDFFYVAVDIRDDEIYISEEASHWQQDAVVVGLDARPPHISAYSQGRGRGQNWLAYLRTMRENDPVYDEPYLPAEVKSALRKTKTSIQLEIAFPTSYLNKMNGQEWQSLRLGIGYYDYDGNGKENTSHFWFPAWNAANDLPGSGMMFKN
jgi:predicted phosphodiesterase